MWPRTSTWTEECWQRSYSGASHIDTGQLEACLRAGMVTETELEREGVLTRALHSRALVVRPLGKPPIRAGVAKR
jgi:hypothetical protein